MTDYAELLERMEGSRLYDYEPLDHAKPFHASQKLIRLVLGGNGSGKSEATCAELAAMMQGPPYPGWFKWIDPPKPPFAVWAVTQKYPKTDKLHAILQKLVHGETGTDKDGRPVWNKPFISPHMMKDKLNRKSLTFTLTNDVVFELKSAESALSAFESVRIGAALIDEPIDGGINTAIRTRLTRYPGARMWLGLTPYEMSSDYLYEMMRDETGAVDCFTFPTTANPYMPKDQLAKLMEGMTDEMKRVRIYGELMSAQGKVYPYAARWPDTWREFERDGFRWSEINDGNWRQWSDVGGAIPAGWTRYVIHDPGINNPAAAVWFAVDPLGNIWCYKYFYDDSKSSNIRARAEAMLAINDGDRIETWYIDPFAGSNRAWSIESGREGDNLRELYRQCGIYFEKGPRCDAQSSRTKRIEAAKLYLEPSCAKPMMWFLPGEGDKWLRREFELYIYEPPVEGKNSPPSPRRKHDHLMYCIETAASLPLRYVWRPDEKLDEDWRVQTTDEIARHHARAWWEQAGRQRSSADVRIG